LANFTDRLKVWLRSGGRIQEDVANKLDEFFTAGLQDWDISRDAPYFGFEIPDHPGKYFYVWLDAPVGYMATTLAWCRQHGADFDSYWRREEESEVVHIIGKDIVYFHALFWPATLMGSGFRTPDELAVHGFLTVNGEKMSKTRGTFINASTYLEHLDPQYLRYYYAAKLSSKVEDLDLSFDDFIQRVNTDLVHKLANIPSRALAILHKSCGGRLGTLDSEGRELILRVRARRDEIADFFERREFALAARLLAELAGIINIYFQEREPWRVAKEDPAAAAGICTAALNGFRILATLLQPILPDFAARTARMLRLPALTWEGIDEILESCLVEPYERLADRVDPVRTEALVAASRENLKAVAPVVAPPQLTLDILVDGELEALRVTTVEMPASGKAGYVLLCFEGGRTVVAHIGAANDFAHLVGKHLFVVTNLIPKKLQGENSQGMILAMETGEGAIPVQVETAGQLETGDRHD
jgi:methionyl-tRNA synthetase